MQYAQVLSYKPLKRSLTPYHNRGIYKLPNRVIRELREELDSLRKESEDHTKYVNEIMNVVIRIQNYQT